MATINETVPQIPNKTVTVTKVTADSIQLSWTKATDKKIPQNKIKYSITWCEPPYTWDNRRKSSGRIVDISSYTITGLKANTAYEIIIYVSNEVGENTYNRISTKTAAATTVVSSTVTRPSTSLATVSSTSSTVSRPSTSTTTPVTPSASYTKEVTEVVQNGRLAFDFELIGGIHEKVINSPNPKLEKKDNQLVLSYPASSSYKGDSDICTKKGQWTSVSVNVGYQKTGKNIEIILLYIVRQQHNDYSVLSLSKRYTLSNLAAYDFENSEIKSWWGFGGAKVNLITQNQLYSGEKKNWCYMDNGKNKTLANLRVKMDGSGNETQKENMGIKGTIYIDYEVRETTKPRLIVEEPVLTPITTPTKGNCSKISSINEKVRSILGHGMYISGQYASIDGDSLADPVLDIDKLNEYQRIDRNTNSRTSSYEINKNGSHEYSKKLETDLTVNVSAQFGLLSFSSETKKTFSEDRYNKDTYKFITRKDVTSIEQYQIQGAKVPNELCAFLTNSFLADLNKLSSDKIVEKYGTHVMLGMKLGGRFDYNYSYLQSINNTTIVKTFSNKTGIKVNMKEDGSLNNALDFSKLYEQRDKYLQEGKIDKAQDIIEKINKLGETASKGSGGSGGAGGGVSVDYSKTETIKDNMSDETFESKAFATGGDHKLAILINGETELEKLKKYKEEWVRGITSANASWCDYLSGTLIPIYEFVPNGKKVTRNSLEKAYKNFIIKNCPKSNTIIGKGVQTHSLAVKEKSAVARLNQHDREISTSEGKETYWKIKLELVNIVDGKIGVAVWYEVHEGGKAADRSKIQLKQVYDIPVNNKSKVAIDENLKTNSYIFDGTYVGKMHDWIDVTTQARGCPFIDTDNAKFQIIIDGPGSSDCEHMALKGMLKVPYQYYADEIRTV
ncbi:MAG: fibronectin type III domain-containing protein [Prevotellaceae bacterium]|jgi:hypothetical protein|nr:fibronectin type III domain-containing protein [Prevotellaceae bacterium]